MLSLSSLKKKKPKQANSCTCSYLVGDRFSCYKNSVLENSMGGKKRELLGFLIYWPAQIGYSTHKSNAVFLKPLSCGNPHETDDSLQEDSETWLSSVIQNALHVTTIPQAGRVLASFLSAQLWFPINALCWPHLEGLAVIQGSKAVSKRCSKPCRLINCTITFLSWATEERSRKVILPGRKFPRVCAVPSTCYDEYVSNTKD